MFRPNLKSVDLPVPEIIAIDVLGWGPNPNLGEEQVVEEQRWAIVRAISFQDFQSMWSGSTNVTYRRTDRRHAIARPRLCTIVHGAVKTRQLSYRKDDCAMRSIYRCPEKFRESLSTPTATFSEILNWILLRSIL